MILISQLNQTILAHQPAPEHDVALVACSILVYGFK